MQRHAQVQSTPAAELLGEATELLASRGLPPLAGSAPREFWVARSGEELVGLAGIEWYGSHGLLRSVAVLEGWEGRGIGSRLVQAALDRFLESGAEDLLLLTTGASGFFARLGFVPVDRQEVPDAVLRSEEFANQCPETAVAMRLDRRRLETVRHYDRSAARAASRGRGRELQDQERSTQEIPMASGGCCSSSGCGCGGAPDEIPSWGCTLDPLFGDPAPGEVVLDLGCGTGRNAFEAARRVGPTGRVYGLDLSPTMLAEARRHRDRLGLSHVSFLQAPMEAVPLPDGSVDLVISDCVLNLSTDKPRVLREAFRVLRPGGRLAIADVVRTVPDPAEPESSEGWSACVDGAITADAYLALLAQAGFTEPSVEVLHGGGAGEAAPRVATAHVRARRA